jgi:glucoamylase
MSVDGWIDDQYAHAGRAMLRSVSPLQIIKTRPGFAQVIHPRRGAIVASPVLGAYDPEPDYFFHWFRDSAVVLDALRLLYEDGSLGADALTHLDDCVQFTLSLRRLDGRRLVAEPAWRAAVAPDFQKFLRSDADLMSAHGDSIAAETRVNADATLDISSWPRPQHDGPALRALTLLRWSRLDAAVRASGGLGELLRSDLRFIAQRWREPSYDIWEEECGQHYYTIRVAAAALEQGAAWFEQQGEPAGACACRRAAALARDALEDFWVPGEGYVRSRLEVARVDHTAARTDKSLDIAVVLAAIHAGTGGMHSAQDPRLQATLARLEAMFDAIYPINHSRPSGRGVAMGRYAGDLYYSGGAYFFSTLGAAEFCFRAASAGPDRTAWIRRGDAFLETVRAYASGSGDLSEQFDQRSGRQTSARHLAWSYAAFISCVHARRVAMGRDG